MPAELDLSTQLLIFGKYMFYNDLYLQSKDLNVSSTHRWIEKVRVLLITFKSVSYNQRDIW